LVFLTAFLKKEMVGSDLIDLEVALETNEKLEKLESVSTKTIAITSSKSNI